MEPIDERADNAWFDYEYTGAPTPGKMFKDGFKAGVQSEHDRLTKWNDPDKPPQHEERVIVDAVLPNGARFVTGGWYAINEYPQGWSVDIDRVFENVSVLGWRQTDKTTKTKKTTKT